jgi:hypothetical protein
MFPIAKPALSFRDISDYWSRYTRVPIVFAQRVAPLALVDYVFLGREARVAPDAARSTAAL